LLTNHTVGLMVAVFTHFDVCAAETKAANTNASSPWGACFLLASFV